MVFRSVLMISLILMFSCKSISCRSNGRTTVVTKNNQVMINGKSIVCPSGSSISIINDAVYINGKLYSDLEIVEGSGTMVTEKREIVDFNKLQVSAPVEVNVSLGNDFKCSVEADDNLIPLIFSEVKDNILYISIKESFSTKNKIKIFIETPELKRINLSGNGQITGYVSMVEELIVSGSGNVNITGINGGSLSAMLSGSGGIALQGVLKDDLNVTFSGSGDVNTRKLKVSKANVVLNGSGDVSIFANHEISVAISGSGDVKCYGGPQKIEKKIWGSGSFKNYEGN